MAKLSWSKLCQTSVHHHKNGLLIAGQPPLWKFDSGLGEGETARLSLEEIVTMVDELAPRRELIEEVPGCRSFCARYAKDIFRVDVLGVTKAHAVIFTRLPPDAPVAIREGRGWYSGWNPDGPRMGWNELLKYANEADAAALVLPGCPLFLWSRWGLHAYETPAVSDDAFRSMIDEIMPPPDLKRQRQGLLDFRVHLSREIGQFRATVFCYPSPTVALLTKLSSEL